MVVPKAIEAQTMLLYHCKPVLGAHIQKVTTVKNPMSSTADRTSDLSCYVCMLISRHIEACDLSPAVRHGAAGGWVGPLWSIVVGCYLAINWVTVLDSSQVD